MQMCEYGSKALAVLYSQSTEIAFFELAWGTNVEPMAVYISVGKGFMVCRSPVQGILPRVQKLILYRKSQESQSVRAERERKRYWQ